jgi:hypothetical protein
MKGFGALQGAPFVLLRPRIAGSTADESWISGKKQGAAGITTAAPHIAGQWGRGEDRLPGLRRRPGLVPDASKFFHPAAGFFETRLSDGRA